MEHPRRSYPVESVTITLTRHEGRLEECDIPNTFTTFDGAETLLRAWSRTAPADGGHHGISVGLAIQSGPMDGTRGPSETYETTFRMGLKRGGVRDLREWLEHQAGFIAGHWRPPHMTEERYKQFLASYLRDPATFPRKLACGSLWSRLRFLADHPMPAQTSAPPGGLVDGESTKEERWETGRVRMTRAAWRATPRDYKTANPRQIMRQSREGGTTLYPVELVD